MKIIIEGEPKDIAALVLEVQERHLGNPAELVQTVTQYLQSRPNQAERAALQ